MTGYCGMELGSATVFSSIISYSNVKITLLIFKRAAFGTRNIALRTARSIFSGMSVKTAKRLHTNQRDGFTSEPEHELFGDVAEGNKLRRMDKEQTLTDKKNLTKAIWKKAKAVCFDVDSTVCMDEAIDELAHFLGVGSEVSAWTKKAMNGNFSFRDALSARLDLIKPSRLQLEDYVRKNPPKLTPGIRELVSELHKRNTAVYLVSGGFTRIILPVADILGVPENNVFANVLHFDEDGDYDGFDESQPTSDSGGKTEVCRMLKTKYNYDPLVMIGDGATDMEASPPADAFIGFGGNQVREKVKAGAHWFVYSFEELLQELRRDNE